MKQAFPPMEKQLQKKILRAATATERFKFINNDSRTYLTIFPDESLPTLWSLLIIPLPLHLLTFDILSFLSSVRIHSMQVKSMELQQ